MMRVGIVSLNPAIDSEWCVDDVLWEEKNVVHAQRRWAGGKGINVARWLQFLGADPELLIPLGGATGREIVCGLRRQRLRARIIPLLEETRVNVVVTTARGRQMRFNPPGPKLNGREWKSVLRVVKEMLARDTTMVLSGALPRGVPIDAYARLIRLAHHVGRRVFLDCDGAALVAGIKAEPFFLKPNLHELSCWAGVNLKTERAIVTAARALSDETNGWILVSLGADGALLVNTRQKFAARATLPKVQVVNTVGAGDALLAAAVCGAMRCDDPIEWLRSATATGLAATQCKGGEMMQRRAVSEWARLIRIRSLV